MSDYNILLHANKILKGENDNLKAQVEKLELEMSQMAQHGSKTEVHLRAEKAEAKVEELEHHRERALYWHGIVDKHFEEYGLPDDMVRKIKTLQTKVEELEAWKTHVLGLAVSDEVPKLLPYLRSEWMKAREQAKAEGGSSDE